MTIAERVPASFKIQERTKKRVDLLATALGVDKSAIIDEAIEVLHRERKAQVDTYLAEAKSGFGGLTPEERLIGRRRERRPEHSGARAAP